MGEHIFNKQMKEVDDLFSNSYFTVFPSTSLIISFQKRSPSVGLAVEDRFPRKPASRSALLASAARARQGGGHASDRCKGAIRNSAEAQFE